jgi:rSAM/selenodomain-associated transferase 1
MSRDERQESLVQSKVNENCVLLFCKSPANGNVKTRLAEEIGLEHAAELYKCFVGDTIWSLKSLDVHFKICFWPADDEQSFIDWLGSELEYLPQDGDNLGDKMKNAFIQMFEESYSKTAIIGSDIPDLPGELISRAMDELDRHDAVIGPSSDGGYYLISLGT